MPRIRITLLLGLAVLPLLAATACGSKSSASTAGATATTQPGGDFAAYRQCLSDHGVTLPDRGQGTGGPPGTDTSGGPPADGSGGYGGRSGAGTGGGFGGPNSTDPAMQAAQDACKDVRPSGGSGGGQGGQGGQAIQAYRSCLQDHSVTLPDNTNGTPNSTTDGTTPGGGRGGGPTAGLDQSDPTVAAAMTACQALLPQRPSGGSDSTGSTTTTATGAA